MRIVAVAVVLIISAPYPDIYGLRFLLSLFVPVFTPRTNLSNCFWLIYFLLPPLDSPGAANGTESFRHSSVVLERLSQCHSEFEGVVRKGADLCQVLLLNPNMSQIDYE